MESVCHGVALRLQKVIFNYTLKSNTYTPSLEYDWRMAIRTIIVGYRVASIQTKTVIFNYTLKSNTYTTPSLEYDDKQL